MAQPNMIIIMIKIHLLSLKRSEEILLKRSKEILLRRSKDLPESSMRYVDSVINNKRRWSVRMFQFAMQHAAARVPNESRLTLSFAFHFGTDPAVDPDVSFAHPRVPYSVVKRVSIDDANNFSVYIFNPLY